MNKLHPSLIVLKAAGYLVAVLGIVVTFGWLTDNALLVQISPNFEPMKFNTALLFALLGAGYAAICYKPRRLPLVLGLIVMTVSLIILSQYFLNADYGIDTFFVKPLIMKRAIYPGRFSLGTGFCFVLSSLALALCSQTARYASKFYVTLIAMAASLLVALVLPALIGYLTGTEDYYVWGFKVGMAPHTAAAFLVLGLAMFNYVMRLPGEQTEWLPLPVFFMLLVMASTFAQAAENEHRRDLAVSIATQGDSIAHNTELYLGGLFRAVDRMDGRWEMRHGTPEAEWEADATEYLKAYPVLYALSWANKDQRLQGLVSLKPLKKMKNFYIAFEPNRRDAIARAMQTQEPQLTDAIQLVQGGRGFIGYNPLFIGGKYDGMLVSAFNIDDMFNTLFSADDRRDFSIKVFEKDSPIYDDGSTPDDAAEPLTARTLSDVRGKKWQFTIAPTRAYLDANHSHLPPAIMVIGLIIAMLVALSLHFGLRQQALRRLLRHSTDQLRYFVKHIPVAFAVVDRDMKYIMVSDRWYSDFRIKQPDITGLSHFQVFFKSPEKWTQILLECLRTGTPSESEDSVVTPSGRTLWLRWNLRPWLDPSGAIGGLLMATEIITDRKEAEAALRAARDAADAASQAKTNFLADMSHEIRTPMNAVIGMTQMLLRTSLDRDQRHYAETVIHSAQSLMHIITDILDLSKIEADKVELEKYPFDLKKFCTQVAEVFQMQTEIMPRSQGPGDVRFILDFDPRCAGFVHGDPLRLRQVLNNLCANALKFTRNGTVTLKVAPTGRTQEVKFAVIDTGIGIPADKIDTIFSKFSQADETISRRYGGTGLGLSISARLVGLMGGTIRVSSVESVGSEFSFIIQLPPAEEVFDRAATPEGVELQWFENVRILLAEDSVINQEVISSFLKRSGISITIANNGEEAVQQVKDGSFDLVLMDCKMPVMDGFAATAAIRRLGGKFEGLPIIALTANALAGDRDQCLAAGMNDYITKPIQQERLLGVINAWLPEAQKGIEISGAGLAAAFDDTSPLQLAVGDIDPVMMEQTKKALGDRFERTLAMFIEETGRLMDGIRTAVQEDDPETAGNIAHVVKASTLQFGAPKVGSHMSNIQKAGEEGRTADILPLLDAAWHDWENFKAALARKGS